MTEIVSLAQRREIKEKDVTGAVKCYNCKHTWQAARDGGVHIFECPNCHCMKGFPQTFVTTNTFWQCSCGCDLFAVGLHGIYCAHCGQPQEPDWGK